MLIRHLQELLGNADIDYQHAGHKLRLDAQRRQRCAAAPERRRAFRQVQLGKHFGRHQHFARRRDERLQACSSDRRRVAHFRGQRDGLDAQ